MSKYRTHNCNSLRGENVDQLVKLAGWVADIRNVSKNLMFVTIRDHYGKTQLVFSDDQPDAFTLAKTLKPESVIIVEGMVKSRGKDNNKNMDTGEIEVIAKELKIDSLVENLPFQLHENPGEDLRLKYRFIDLRRTELQESIKLRFKHSPYVSNYEKYHPIFREWSPRLALNSKPRKLKDELIKN